MKHKKIRMDNKTVNTIACLLICLATVFIYFNGILSEENFNYAIEEMHSYDNNLYADNINIVGAEYSPRLYANFAMSLIMHLSGGNWESAGLGLICINYFLYAIAITMFVSNYVKEKRLLSVVLTTVACMSGTLVSLAFFINAAQEVFFGTAIAIALIAMACVMKDKPNWDMAWVLLALAELMHVHEGIWAGGVVGVMWIADSMIEKKIGWKKIRILPVYILSVLMVVIPSLLKTSEVDEELFKQIYVFIRTPHHLLVSYWGWNNVLMATLMIFGAVYVLFRELKTDISVRKEFCSLFLLSGLWVLIIVIEYIATEVLSIPMVITMYLPKALKYITFIASLVYIKYGLKKLFNRSIVQGLSLLIILFMQYTGFWFFTRNMLYGICFCLFLLFAIFEYRGLEQKFFKSFVGGQVYITVVYILVFCLVLQKIYFSMGISKIHVFLIICFFTMAFDLVLNRIQLYEWGIRLAFVCLGGLFLLSTKDSLYTIENSKIKILSGQQFIKNTVGNDLYDLAKTFENKTDTNIMFLADPDSAVSNGFQLVSHRSCYRLYKNTPSNKECVIEWYNDIENVRKIKTCTAEELVKMLDEIELEYVLVDANRFSELNTSEMFQTVVKNDKFGVYKIVK